MLNLPPQGFNLKKKKKAKKKQSSKKAPEKRSVGAPLKYNEDIFKFIMYLCAEGKKTDQEIADLTGVCRRTINNWKSRFPDLKVAMADAKDIIDQQVEDAFLTRALGYSHPETKVFFSDGKIIEHVIEKHYPPDTLAQFKWLMNRRPKKWRDKHTVTNTYESIEDCIEKLDKDEE